MCKPLNYRFFTLPSPLWSEVLALRMQVFVEEMGVPVELEVDTFDQQALHMGGYPFADSQNPWGTLRILITGQKAKLGRLAVHKDQRRKGIGSAMLQQAIRYCEQQNVKKISLAAQTYITDFYKQSGFQTTGNVFDDAGIPHIEMFRITGAP